MKHLTIVFLSVVFTSITYAAEPLQHRAAPYELSHIVLADTDETIKNFDPIFQIAPACHARIDGRSNIPEVVGVSRNYIKLRGDFKKGDKITLSCGMNITRRLYAINPDAEYPR